MDASLITGPKLNHAFIKMVFLAKGRFFGAKKIIKEVQNTIHLRIFKFPAIPDTVFWGKC